MSANRLNLNSSKTPLIWFGTKQQLFKLDLPLQKSMYPDFTYSSSVRDLGVTLDSTLSFCEHLVHLMRSCYYHLRRLRAIRPSVSSSVFTTIVHAFICCRIGYCSSLFASQSELILPSVGYDLNSQAHRPSPS